ncbi:MAG TPA: hypothetical protein VEQ40_11415 [Pyrinomonadaceae bacterium]|nr:hypothetical protein [Pyrinomonadaceae bacterium]
MPSESLERLLERLEELKRPGGVGENSARLLKILSRLERRSFTDAHALIRFHESLLFMRAYPQSAAHLRQVERLLSSFKQRVDKLRASGADMSPFSEPDVSGIAGTSFSALFSYEVTREIARLFPSETSIDWDGYEEFERFAAVAKRFLPLVEENAYVEPRFPFPEWLRAARPPGEKEIAWLLKRFEQLDVPEEEKSSLFNSLKLWLRWEFRDDNRSRTRMKLKARKIFYHDAPQIERRDVSLEREMRAQALPVRKLKRGEGQKLLDAGRATMAARYRELHGFTYGDAGSFVRAEAGRGVEFLVWGVRAEHRLPTLGYHAALILKNGVPHGYAEALSLFERSEVGLNLFYTFREGESAWIYARLLRLFRQLLGVTAFSIDPYQLGFHNEEGIASGAFWFYRKLGFRPVEPELLRLVLSEEARIARRKEHRTSASALRRLASGHVLYEYGQAGDESGWSGFHMRNLGLAVQRRMGERFKGDAGLMRRASLREISRTLGLRAESLNADEERALSDWSLILSLIPDLSSWSDEEKGALVNVVRAKAGSRETRYLHVLQKHRRLREAIMRLGGRRPKGKG